MDETTKNDKGVKPLIVISYIACYQHYCGRGCHCLLDSATSDFELKLFQTEEEVSSYIVERVLLAPKAGFIHHIFSN